MNKILFFLACSIFAIASEGTVHSIDLTTQWIGIVSFGIFVIGYYFIAAEEKYHINKAIPALFIGTFMFVLVGIYYALHGLDQELLNTNVEHLILEIAEIFFFLFVAMTFIETLIERNVFDVLKYKLVSKGYSYKKLFWLTGVLAFFISPVADNLTTALILSTVLYTIDKHNKPFLIAGAINIVVAANAGGAWSPFGDITTLMTWTANKAEFVQFLGLFPASIVGWIITGYLLSRTVPTGQPEFDADVPSSELKSGAKVVIFLGVFTIVCAVLGHQLLSFPAMWGMMFGLASLKLYSFFLNRQKQTHYMNIYVNMEKVENDTLLFFFGILSAVGALHFLGFLDYIVDAYDVVGSTVGNIGVGFVSAIVDNVPVMSAIIKANPHMTTTEWLLATLTAGIGGSLISFGSAAGVGVMGKLKGIYTFGAHMRYSWMVLVGYAVSIAVWYLQYEILKFSI